MIDMSVHLPRVCLGRMRAFSTNWAGLRTAILGIPLSLYLYLFRQFSEYMNHDNPTPLKSLSLS
jgi:hypothetical protein